MHVYILLLVLWKCMLLCFSERKHIFRDDVIMISEILKVVFNLNMDLRQSKLNSEVSFPLIISMPSCWPNLDLASCQLPSPVSANFYDDGVMSHNAVNCSTTELSMIRVMTSIDQY